MRADRTDRRRRLGAVLLGGNAYGQLGDGTTTSSLVPKRVVFADGAQVARTSVGDDLTCAIVRPSNQVRCWGNNDAGQAGQDPSLVTMLLSPAIVSGVPIANGIFSGAHVSRWERATRVPGLSAIDTMRAGTSHTCVMLTNPGVQMRGRCWGSNDHGQLGTEPLGVDQPSAIATKAIDASPFDTRMSEHACKIDMMTGFVWCWGRNDDGQLGDGARSDSAAPVQVRL